MNDMQRWRTLCETLTPRIEPLDRQDVPAILRACVMVFTGKGMSDEHLVSFVQSYTDWQLSRKLMLGDQMIGFYLLREGSIIELANACGDVTEDLTRYQDKRGVEGIALVVIPEYRGTGYGNLLKNYPKTMGYDYIYGMQLKTLGNLDDWLKRRRLIADCHDVWVTLEDFV